MEHRASVGLRVVLLALVGVQLSCGGGGDAAGPNLVAATIVANSATAQGGIPGAAVADPPSVVVRDQNGALLAGASVTFTVTGGGGSVTGGSVVSNAAGVATVGGWVLGSANGTNTLDARVGTLPPIQFLAIATRQCVPNGTYVIGTTATGALETTDCQFSFGSYFDLLSTTVASPDALLFNMTAAYDAVLVLYTAGGQLVAVNDDISNTVHDSRIKALLPAGDFVLAPTSFDPNVVGSYSLSSSTNAPTVTNCEEVYVMRGVTSTQALEATDCADTRGFKFDGYFIYVAAGQAVTVSMNSSSIDSYLEIYDPTGRLVTSNDNKTTTTQDAQVSFTGSGSGFYAIFARPAATAAAGPYTLIVQ